MTGLCEQCNREDFLTRDIFGELCQDCHNDNMDAVFAPLLTNPNPIERD